MVYPRSQVPPPPHAIIINTQPVNPQKYKLLRVQEGEPGNEAIMVSVWLCVYHVQIVAMYLQPMRKS